MKQRNTILSIFSKKIIFGIAVFFYLIFPEIGNSQDVKVNATLDTNSILIGQQTTLTMSILTPEKMDLDFNLLTDSIPETIEIIEIKSDTSKINDHKSINYHFLITSFDSGYYAIPPLKIIYKLASDTNVRYAESEPMLLEVRTIPVDLDGEIKDLKDVLAEPMTFMEFIKRYYLPLIGILTILTLIIVILIRLQRRKKKANQQIEPLLPPDIEAIEALIKLKEEKLWQNDRVKDYYSKITDILRRYIERRFDIPAQEMVTSEIVGCANSSGLEKEQVILIEKHFNISDLVKFAKYSPIQIENEEIMDWAFQFIENTKMLEKSEEEES